jgi:hypothetical protein
MATPQHLTPWVVCRGNGKEPLVIECLRCHETHRVVLPIDLKDLPRVLSGFQQTHECCQEGNE